MGGVKNIMVMRKGNPRHFLDGLKKKKLDYLMVVVKAVATSKDEHSWIYTNISYYG
jgi:hypothetical protein